MSTPQVLRWYYAATAIFLLLDYGFSVNLRIAFLESQPAARAAYYAVCFACLWLMAWRPAWSAAIGAVESAVTIGALIISLMLKIMSVNESIVSENAVIFGFEDVGNFILSGSIAYLSWVAALKRLKSH